MRVFVTDEFRRHNLKFSAPRLGDAGYDLFAAEEVRILPGKRSLIRTGLHVEIPQGHVGLIKDRSSVALDGLHVFAGVIDPSYRGELKVLMFNTNEIEYTIQVSRKIAQMVVVAYYDAAVELVDRLEQLSQSGRGIGGFGSTGG